MLHCMSMLMKTADDNHSVQWTLTRGRSGLWLTVCVLSRLPMNTHCLGVETARVKLDAMGLVPLQITTIPSSVGSKSTIPTNTETEWVLNDWRLKASERLLLLGLSNWMIFSGRMSWHKAFITANMLFCQAPRKKYRKLANRFDKWKWYAIFYVCMFLSHWCGSMLSFLS